MISLFVIMYVWQNIEVMKIKMGYRILIKAEEQLVKDNDRLLYEIERYKRMKVIDRYALENNLKKITLRDFDVLVVKEKDVNNKKI